MWHSFIFRKVMIIIMMQNNSMNSHISPSHLWDTCKHKHRIDLLAWRETVGMCQQWSGSRNAAAATDSGAAVLPLLDTSGTQSCWASASCRMDVGELGALWLQAPLASPQSCESRPRVYGFRQTQKLLTRYSQWAVLPKVWEISSHLFFGGGDPPTHWIWSERLTKNTDS